MLYEINYASAGCRLFDQGELADILALARRNNRRLSVTGILLYEAGSFLQVLEGEQAIVTALFTRISTAPRHSRVQILREGAVAARSFGDWTMGFVSLDARLRAALPERHALSSNGTLQVDKGAVLPLLDAFRDGRYRSYILG